MERNEPTTMLMLPEEILACILNSTMSYTTFCGHNVSFSESTIWALARTCHHLYRIAIPLIYRNLRLRFPQRILRPACSSGNLLRTLNADPSLATFCYDLGLVVFDACPARCEADFKKFEYFLPWFKNVKVLHLEANFDRNSRGASWRFIQRCAQRMPRLESLFLKGRNWAAPSIPDVLQQIQIPTLRELTVDGKSTSDLTLEMPKNFEPSSITKLHLNLVQAQAKTLAALLNWPGALSDLSIKSFSTELADTNQVYRDFDLPMLQKLLLRHKDSLTHLRLPYLEGAAKGQLVNFSEFSLLEELAFPRALLNDHLDETPENLSQLLAPKIKSFILIVEIHSTKEWSDMGAGGCIWVRNLAQEALRKRSTLNEISIQFTSWVPRSAERLDHLWDGIQQLDCLFRPRGIGITHSAQLL